MPKYVLLRVLAPQVLGILVRRGNDFAAAEDAVQDALLEAHRSWGDAPPGDPKGWLLTVAGRKLTDSRRSEAARRRREGALSHQPEPGPAGQADDTLLLLFLCCHPALNPASAIALTLRAVGGLTTRQIAEAFLVPEATMAQRISRAKRTVSGQPFTQPGDVAVVLRALYLIFNEGYSGRVNLSAEAIRLARQLVLACDEPEVAGLLALMLRPGHAAPPSATTSPSKRPDCAAGDRDGFRDSAGHGARVVTLVDDVHKNLAGFVEDFVTEPTTMPWGNRSLLFRDPEGNLVNFFTPCHPGHHRKVRSLTTAQPPGRHLRAGARRCLGPAQPVGRSRRRGRPGRLLRNRPQALARRAGTDG